MIYEVHTWFYYDLTPAPSPKEGGVSHRTAGIVRWEVPLPWRGIQGEVKKEKSNKKNKMKEWDVGNHNPVRPDSYRVQLPVPNPAPLRFFECVIPRPGFLPEARNLSLNLIKELQQNKCCKLLISFRTIQLIEKLSRNPDSYRDAENAKKKKKI